MDLYKSKLAWILGGFEYLHADDLVANPGAGGATFRTDQLGTGQHVPYTKLMDGTADGTGVIPGDATNGLYVQVKASVAVPVTDNSGSLTVDNAGTFAVQAAQSGTWTVQPGNTANTTAWKVDASSAAVPVTDNSGSLTIDTTQLPSSLGQKAMAGSVGVALASDQSALPITDNSGSLTVDFTGQQTADYDTGAGTVTQLMVGLALPASGGPVAGGTATNPIQVSLANTGSNGTAVAVSAASLPLPSGAATAAKQPAIGTAGSASTDVITVQGIASGTALPVSLASVPSHAVTNAGTFAVQADGSVASGSADSGAPVKIGGKYNSSPITLTNGQRGDIQLDASGFLKVNLAAGGGSGGTALSDKAAFTEGSTSHTPIGGVYNETIASDPTEDQAAAVRITAKRAMHVNLRDSSGNELSAGAQYAEDAAHTSGDLGTMALVRRSDSASSSSGSDGDYSTMNTDASGRLWVNASGVAVPITDNSGSITVDNGGTFAVQAAGNVASGATDSGNPVKVGGVFNSSPITVTTGQRADLQTDANGFLKVNVAAGGASGGTSSSVGSAVPSTGTAAGFSDGTNMQLARVFDVDSGAGTQYAIGVNLRKIASGGSVEAATSSDPLRVDPTGTTTQPVSIAATVTVDTELPAAAALADAVSNPTIPAVGADNAVFNGTTWDRMRSVINGQDTAGTGIPAAGILGQLDDTSTGTVTENQFAPVRISSRRALLVEGVASGTALNAAQSGTWTVQPGNTANTTPWLVTPSPATSGGLTVQRTLSAASTNATSVKGSAGQVYGWFLYNTTSSAKFFKLYNKASSPTVGSDTPFMTIPLPATSGSNVEYSMGIPMGTGIAFAITGAVADADSTAVAANDVIVNLFYK